MRWVYGLLAIRVGVPTHKREKYITLAESEEAVVAEQA